MRSNHFFKKKFGQNFLKGSRFVKYLVDPLKLTNKDFVIEIGPGDGVVTWEILQSGAELRSIEIDNDLIPKLKDKFYGYTNFAVINQNILDLDFSKIIPEHAETVKFVGSLPYNISKKIIEKIAIYKLESRKNIMACFIVQEEVAKDYVALVPKASFLSNFLRMISKVKKLQSIPAGQFFPRPKVDGGIIKIEFNSIVDPEKVKKVWKIMRIGFSSPRKRLLKNLEANQHLDKQKLKEIIQEQNINLNIRAAELETEQWEKLSEAI